MTSAYNNRGSLYKILKKYEAALKDFNRAIEINPSYAHGYSGRGLCYKQLGRLEEAKADLDTALKLVPGSLLFLLNLATIYLAMSDQQKAQEIFDQSLELFDEGNEAELKKKYNLTDKNLEFIKKSMSCYRQQEKEIEELESLSKEQGRDDILATLPRLEQMNKIISIKSSATFCKSEETETEGVDENDEDDEEEKAEEKISVVSEISANREESTISKDIALMKK
jgi:tetratricopeptide (TPR) repeat protein